ncbi:Spore germination protein KA [Trichinella spiralis]|uniref:Spore germination protein KA n=1 Tax=Trichinella spiralis TaxID=6334 RepID=A0ABR3KDS0_TRISP
MSLFGTLQVSVAARYEIYSPPSIIEEFTASIRVKPRYEAGKRTLRCASPALSLSGQFSENYCAAGKRCDYQCEIKEWCREEFLVRAYKLHLTSE